MHEDFSIGVGPEAMPSALEVGAQLPKVVDLAVEDHPDGAVLIGQRSDPGRTEIDDGQPTFAETDALLRVDAFAIGPPMYERRAHARNQVPFHRRPVEGHLAANPTHQYSTS